MMVKKTQPTLRELYRRLLILGAILVLFLIVADYLAGLFFHGNAPEFSDDNELINSLFVFFLINLNVIILSYLLFLIIKNIVKIILERRHNILGSRLKAKLVFAFTGLSVVPTIVLFFIAKGFISYFMSSYSDIIDLYRPIDSSYTLMLVSITFLIIFLSIWIGLHIAQNISQPIRLLARATNQVAKGNFGFEVTRSTDDEMGELVTSFNTMMRELKRANEELAARQRMEAWQDVAKRIAHEIKNPLTPIQLSAQRIQKKFKDKENNGEQIKIGRDELKAVLDSSKTIVEQVQALRTLVNEFSQFARMPNIALEKVQINDLLLNVYNLYNQSRNNIIFKLEVDEKVPELNLDKDQINRVFVNLLDNAVAAIDEYFAKAIKHNGERAEIDIKSVYDANLGIVSIIISNNGSCINTEFKDKIFEPYVTNKKNGTGLGLAIVSSIIAGHDGFIRVKDVVPHGASFVIELPVRR